MFYSAKLFHEPFYQSKQDDQAVAYIANVYIYITLPAMYCLLYPYNGQLGVTLKILCYFSNIQSDLRLSIPFSNLKKHLFALFWLQNLIAQY
ncbi:hypothetical protein XENTR_v10024716 [Xenopus tropicalis]|nr:hypothetical protein XENTR_v10024716 [Xenopus tropicalis]